MGGAAWARIARSSAESGSSPEVQVGSKRVTVSDEATFDARGWAAGPIRPLARSEAYSLFSTDASARFDEAALARAAAAILGANLHVEPAKHFPRGAIPRADRAILHIRATGIDARVEAILFPAERAPDLVAAARRVGRAGMETFAVRARSVVQLASSADLIATLACAATLGHAWRAAILPPHEDTLFGIKGARERLEAALAKNVP